MMVKINFLLVKIIMFQNKTNALEVSTTIPHEGWWQCFKIKLALQEVKYDHALKSK